VSLPATLGPGPVSVGPTGQQLSFALQGASASAMTSGSTSTYAGALPGVDVAYATSSESVRETLTLASASAPTSYKYDLSLSSGLKASLSPSGGVDVRDVQGKLVYWLAAPTVSDSSSPSDLPAAAPVHYELSSDGSVLSLVLDKSWLEDPARVFPVKIDPDIHFGESQDCTIANGSHANTSLCGGRLKVGESSEGISRALLQFNLSSIPKASEINSTRLALWFEADTSSTPLELEADALSPNQFTHAATWNKYDGTNAWGTPGGDVLKTQAGEAVIKNEEKGGWVDIGFTPQVEQWVRDSTSNHGLLLKSHNETGPPLDTFIQTDSGEKSPELEVVYVPRMGNPGDQSMYQLPIGGGGTLGVNVANGNLRVSDPDVRYDAEGYATDLVRSYNSFDENELTSSAFGDGWRLNMGEDELLYPAGWDESNAFHQPDGSYTRFDRAPWADGHPSAGDKAYTGEAYVPESLTVHENGTRTIKYNTGVEWQFDNSGAGFPQKIVDPGGEGNTISLAYTSSQLTKVTDTHGHALTLTREPTDHEVTKIAGTGSGEHWTYTYKELLLTTVTNPAKEKEKYGYYENGYLKDIEDSTGTIVISYDAYKRVSSLRKLVNGTIKKAGSEDEITTFSYETDQTKVTNPEGGISSYYYDEFGNIVEEPSLQQAASEFYSAYAEVGAEAAAKDMNLEDQAAILDTQLGQQLGPNYTGEWFDPTTGHIKIGLTSGYEQTAERDLDNLGLADNTDLVASSASWTALESADNSLASTLHTLAEEGLVTIGIAPNADAVSVEKADSLSEAQSHEVAEALAGLSVPTQLTEAPTASVAPEADHCSEGNCEKPLRGGVQITAHNGDTCTAGFIVESNHAPTRYLMTAGHCVAIEFGEPWKAKFGGGAQETIGTGHSYAFGYSHPQGTFYGDVGLINLEGSFWNSGLSPIIITYKEALTKVTLNEAYPIRSTFTETMPRKNMVVCTGGVGGGHTLEDCGNVEKLVKIHYQGETTKIEPLVQAYFCAYHTGSNLHKGDSGAPVYKNNVAYGILTGNVGCIGDYQPINLAESALHVHVVTAPSP
jgi:YD repeat-containing protein